MNKVVEEVFKPFGGVPRARGAHRVCALNRAVKTGLSICKAVVGVVSRAQSRWEGWLERKGLTPYPQVSGGLGLVYRDGSVLQICNWPRSRPITSPFNPPVHCVYWQEGGRVHVTLIRPSEDSNSREVCDISDSDVQGIQKVFVEGVEVPAEEVIFG